jgi:hypothetical protein
LLLLLYSIGLLELIVALINLSYLISNDYIICGLVFYAACLAGMLAE